MTQPPNLSQHLLTRSDLAKLGIPAGRILSWLANGWLDQVGNLPGSVRGEDPVFAVGARELQVELAPLLADIGKPAVVFSSLRVRSVLLRALLGSEVGQLAVPSAPIVSAPQLPDPVAQALDGDALPDVLRKTAETLVDEVADVVAMAKEAARLDAIERTIDPTPSPTSEAEPEATADTDAESLDQGDFFDVDDLSSLLGDDEDALLDPTAEPLPTPSHPPAPLDQEPVSPMASGDSGAETSEPAPEPAATATDPTQPAGGEVLPAVEAATADSAARTQEISAVAAPVAEQPAMPASPAEPSPTESGSTDPSQPVGGDLPPAQDSPAVHEPEAVTNPSAPHGNATMVDAITDPEPVPAATTEPVPQADQELETPVAARSLDDAFDALLAEQSSPAAPTLGEATPAFVEPATPADAALAELATTADVVVEPMAVDEPLPAATASEPASQLAQVEAAAEKPPTVTALEGARDQDAVADTATASLALERVESFLSELRLVLVEMASRSSPAPSIDMAPLVGAVQQGFAQNSATSGATDRALANLADTIGTFGAKVEHGVALAVHAALGAPPGRPSTPAPAGTPTFVVTRPERSTLALLGIGFLLLCWTVVFYVKTGSLQIALAALIGANLIGCILLIGRRRD